MEKGYVKYREQRGFPSMDPAKLMIKAERRGRQGPGWVRTNPPDGMEEEVENGKRPRGSSLPGRRGGTSEDLFSLPSGVSV